MTVRSPIAFGNSPSAGFDGLFDWDYLIPVLQEETGRGIEPSDIDGAVEIKGHLILFETKNVNDWSDLKQGQMNLLRALWYKGDITVVTLLGKPNPRKCEVWYPTSFEMLPYRRDPVTAEWIIKLVRRWARWAEHKAKPLPRPLPWRP